MAAPPSPWRKRRRSAIMLMLMIALALLGYRWWSAHWRPDQARWPTQGVAIAAANAPISWPSLMTQGIGFAYIDATRGAGLSNPHFTADHDDALAAGLRIGTIHHYRLCISAMEQAANFVRLVPREEAALPPIVMLEVEDDCGHQPTRALLMSELTTFLTQLETHMGKAAVIAPTPDFEERFAITGAINRPLVAISLRSEPGPDDPPWLLWLANDRLTISGSTGPTRLMVLGDQRGDTR